MNELDQLWPRRSCAVERDRRRETSAISFRFPTSGSQYEDMEGSESEMTYLPTVFSIAASVFAIWVVIRIRKQFDDLKYFERMNVPYRKGVPFLGNTFPIIAQKMTFPDYITDVYGEFPNAKYSGAFEFGHRVFVIRDPELIKIVTVKHFDHFTDHKPFVDESIDPFFGRNLFFLRGERWKEMRSIVSPVFTASKMRGMFELMAKCAEDFASYMEKEAETSTLDLQDAFRRYTNDMIATTAFGVSVNSLADRENEFYLMGKDATNFLGRRLLKMFLIMWAPKLMSFLGFEIVSKQIREFFCNIVRETVETRRRDGIVRPDLIHLLMEARHKDGDDKLSVEEIASQAFLFFVAGFETSATFMCFTSHMLAVHPEVQERLIAEVDAVFEENNGVLSYETVNRLVYCEMVFNETLRRYPPLSFTERVATQKFDLPPIDENSKPVTVYPDERIWIPIYALHHDPQYFPDPEKFEPERFSPEKKAKVNPFTFMPFGVGPRMCPGNRFALMEAKLVLCHLLRKFRLRPCEKTRNPPVIVKSTPNITSKHGFWLSLEPREDRS